MGKFKIINTVTEIGPYVSKIILEMPFEVKASEVSVNSFNIYTEKRDTETDEIIVTKNFMTGEEVLNKGFVTPWKVYPCDKDGKLTNISSQVAIELKEIFGGLYRSTEGDLMSTKVCKNYFRITMLHTIDDDPAKSGLVFDECSESLWPQLNGWQTKKYPNGDKHLNYGYFIPEKKPEVTTPFGPHSASLPNPFEAGKKWPLIVWLHGAGEGGMDPFVSICSNRISHLSDDEIQEFFGGAAFILAPQCPTVWMDDGVEKLGKSNKSIYVEPLKECIDNFIEENKERVDMNRIYVGGMSNGGFMTMRMILDYPDFFACAIPNCEVFYSENISDEMLSTIADLPIWFVHCKHDELVPPRETAVPTYNRLKSVGATNVHFTYYEYLYDFTGRYKDEYGAPVKWFNHAVWNNCLANECHTDMDGSNVLVDGEAVTIWEWVARQSRS